MPFGQGVKRTYVTRSGVARRRRAPAVRRRRAQGRRFRPGYDRQSGFFGRFSGPGGEKKFFDTDITDAAVAAGMTFHNLTIVPQDNTENGRVGRKITIRNIHVKGSLVMAPATVATNTANIIKYMIVQDTQTNGAQFGATDLLEGDVIDEYRNLANQTRFKVLASKYCYLNAGGAAASGAAFVFSQDAKWFKFNKRVQIPIEYDNSSTDGAITSVRTNNIYLVSQSINGTGVAAAGNVRIRYTDV